MTNDGWKLPQFDPQQAAASLSRIAERTQQLVTGFFNRRPELMSMGMSDPGNVGRAFGDLTQRMLADPMSLATATWDLWNEHFRLWQHAAQRMIGTAEPADTGRRDKRFRDAAWADNAVFEYIKQSYLLSADAILSAVRKVEGLDPADARRRSSTPASSSMRSHRRISSRPIPKC